MNQRFQNVIKGIAQDIPPIWFMRQAGRYHRHYQALRKSHGFMELCKDARLAAEVALGPIQDFGFDISILFSDLLFPLEALGMGLTYDPAPKLAWHLSESTLGKLRPWKDAVAGVAFQKDAVEATRRVLPDTVSLIGFVGGPWTLFTYAVEGEHKGNLIKSKSQPALFHKFCERLVPLLEENIALQLAGGAELVMILDTAAGEVSPGVFRDEIERYLNHFAAKFPKRLGYYAKGTTNAHVAGVRRNFDFAGFGFDHRYDLPAELKSQPFGFCQGNFDQTMLFGDTAQFERRLNAYLKPFTLLSREQRRGWVCGLGHGVLPQTPEEHVRYFVKHVREVFSV